MLLNYLFSTFIPLLWAIYKQNDDFFDKRNNIKVAAFHLKIMTFKGVITVLTRGEIWSSAFLIFLFEKNMSEGFEVQDCIPEV